MSTLNSIELKDRVINFIGRVNEDGIKDAIEKINNINIADDEWFENLKSVCPAVEYTRDMIPPIRIVMSTFGGSVYDGFALFDIIRNSETPVVVECAGKIMSMGIVLMLAAKKRISHPHTTFMIHAVSSGAFGQLKDLEEDVEETKRVNSLIFDIIERGSDIKRDRLEDIYAHKKDWYMTPYEAKALGLIDEIIG